MRGWCDLSIEEKILAVLAVEPRRPLTRTQIKAIIIIMDKIKNCSQKT